MEISKEETNKVEKDWGLCLVGKISGRRFSLQIVERRFSAIWKIKGHFFVLPLNNSFLLFCFDLEEDRNRVLQGGPGLLEFINF